MVRTLSWLLNGALFAACCFFVANTANTVFAALMAPEPAPRAPEPGTAEGGARDFEVILGRNIFNASLLAPAASAVEEAEDLEATSLPLQLLGTVAGARPEQSWAAVMHTAKRETLILRPGDPVADGAELVRIERRRIVLLEKGAHRELALDEPSDGNGLTRVSPSPPAPQAPRAARPRPDRRLRQLAQNRFEVPGADPVRRNPTSIFQEAQFQPRYENGQMVGMQINAIQPGSVFQEAGIESGDIISEVNGIVIDSPEASAEIVTEFAEADELTIVVEGKRGARTVSFPMPRD